MRLTAEQEAILAQCEQGSVFLNGSFGTGKTTCAVERMLRLIAKGSKPSGIMVLVPQRSLGKAYLEALQQEGVEARSPITLVTIGGLARRMVDLFWPLLGEAAGFKHPELPPKFLTLESSQYYMAHLVSPLFDKGYFSSLTLERNRIYSQILDNLSKAANAGFPISEIGARLKAAWIGDSGQLNIYENVQDCATLFRNFCLENNTLDYSLQIEILRQLILPSKLFQQYLNENYQHMIYDNCEEDPAFVHEIAAGWIGKLESAIIVNDQGGGYRRFLGADPDSALRLAEICEHVMGFEGSFVNSPKLAALQKTFFETNFEMKRGQLREKADLLEGSIALPAEGLRYYPEMLDWVVREVKELIDGGTTPNQIALLAPYLSDMLRFSLTSRLSAQGVAHRSFRPSRALRDEPAVQCLLSLTALAHPEWDLLPSAFHLAYALMVAIEDLDLIRAQILVENLYQPKNENLILYPFSSLADNLRTRVSYRLGEAYERLRVWLEAAKGETILDIFLSRLFGEVLSQKGFGFHAKMDSGHLTANLIESVQKFRMAMGELGEGSEFVLGKEYLKMVAQGVIAAQYQIELQREETDAVIIAPAYTFLIQNQAVEHQFWLDISSSGWYERLQQPLTHPYVLSSEWEMGKKWTAEDETKLSHETLQRLVSGLMARCRKSIYLGISDLNENGSDARGLLLKMIQAVLVGERNG